MAGMENIYDILAKENEQSRQVGIDYSKIREGGVAAAVMAQAGGMLGGSVMQAAGFKTAAQKTQEGREKLQQMHPNPTTYQDMVAMANDAKNLGLSGDWEKIMKVAEAMNDTKSTSAQTAKDKELEDAYIYHEKIYGPLTTIEKNYFKARIKKDVSISGVDNTVIDTAPNVYKSIIENRGINKNLNPAQNNTPVSSVNISDTTPTDSTKRLRNIKDTKDLEGMNTQFVGETKNLKENISTIETGINIVNQVRNGNTAAMPQMERILAKFNSDKRISNPEVQQVMKIGGLGQRIANSISRFISGDTSAQTLNDIEEMFVRIGQLDQGKYNSKVDDYTSKYGRRYDKDTLSKWIPASTAQFFTTAQKLELARQELKRRGK